MSNPMMWEPGPRAPQLATDEVHVWSILLAASGDLVSQLREYLSHDELNRAARYLAERHRRRFIVSHARQREILARYLDCPPANIRFRYEGLGKPDLDDQFSDSRIRFNLSHSGDVTLLAIALDIDIGVDVEKIREMSNLEEFCQRYFSAQECAELISLSPEQRRVAFFHCWTRKEAILKATGKGLTLPLDQFVVSLRPDEPAKLLSVGGTSGRADDWWLAALDPASGYVGAVARRSATPCLHCWEFGNDTGQSR